MRKTITMITATLLLGAQSLKGTPPFMGAQALEVQPPTGATKFIPDNWHIFNSEERTEYRTMQALFGGPDFYNNRSKRLSVFQEMLSKIEDFVERDPARRDVRGMACGILCRDPFILINVHSLGSLLSKCKSGINDVIRRIGYEPMNCSEIPKHFPDILPKLKKVRSWSIRRRLPAEPMSAEVRPATSEAPEDRPPPVMPWSLDAGPAAPGNRPPPSEFGDGLGGALDGLGGFGGFYDPKDPFGFGI
jgi:hypothetical protein